MPKTAFTAPFWHYDFKVLSFDHGLTNAPATYQAVMNDICRLCLGKFVSVYLDGILVFKKTLEEHAERPKRVLQLLCEHSFYAKRSRCDLNQPELEFLGHVFGVEDIKVDPRKTAVARDWPTSSNVSDLCSFLGLTDYFRHFIKGYADIAGPLTNLLIFVLDSLLVQCTIINTHAQITILDCNTQGAAR